MSRFSPKPFSRHLRAIVFTLAAVVIAAFASRFIIGYPVPVIDSVFGPYHVYSQPRLAEVLQQIPFAGNLVTSQYHSSCFFESGAITLTGKDYRCASSYNAVFSSSADRCTNYDSVHQAMEEAKYRYSSATTFTLSLIRKSAGAGAGDCQTLLSRTDVIASYVSDALVQLSHGHGRVDCYFPAQVSGESQLNNSNTYNCTVVIDTDQLSDPPVN